MARGDEYSLLEGLVAVFIGIIIMLGIGSVLHGTEKQGYAEGYEQAQIDFYDQYYEEGYEAGYEQGYEDYGLDNGTYEEGREDGYAEGYADCGASSYKDLRDEWYIDGYLSGYVDCEEGRECDENPAKYYN